MELRVRQIGEEFHELGAREQAFVIEQSHGERRDVGVVPGGAEFVLDRQALAEKPLFDGDRLPLVAEKHLFDGMRSGGLGRRREAVDVRGHGAEAEQLQRPALEVFGNQPAGRVELGRVGIVEKDRSDAEQRIGFQLLETG